MSSGESRTTTSSRLSQFGLYRSIDARTEEFLRLSRKRQIRQGCACAAVSTAITVTVVVTVLLIYEYTVSTESNSDQKTNRKPNWFGLFNDSAPFEAKYNKAKLNIDPTTLKLLPIILKALNHNRYLEKLIEDSSSSPIYERKDTTEFAFKKNVFSDAKNWFKDPNSKTYEIEYKTSPIAYFKLPSSNLDYYGKIRKIREYQRVLNYFDKMISDKVKYGSTQPDIEDAKTERPKKKAVPVTKFQQSIPVKPKKQLNPVYISKTPTMISEPCTCPKKLGLLLSKLITNIHELIPEIMIAKISCNNSKLDDKKKDSTTYITTKIPILGFTKSSILSTIPKSTTVVKKLITTTEKVKATTYSTQRKKSNSLIKSFEQDSKDIADDASELDFMKKFYNSYRAPSTTINKAYLEATKAELLEVTEPMRKATTDKIVRQPNNKKEIIEEDETTESYSVPLSTTTDFEDKDYNDYNSTTTESDNSNRKISFQNSKPHNSEKILQIQKPKRTLGQRVPSTSNIVNITKYLDILQIQQNFSSTTPSKVEINYKTTLKTTVSPTAEPKIDYKSSATTRKVYVGKGLTTTKRGKETILTPPRNTSTTIKLRFFDDEENKPSEDDFGEQDIMTQIDHIINPSIKRKKIKNENYVSLQEGPVTIKSIDSSKMLQPYNEIEQRILKFKSMLPISRPIYLEINRNDFNHDSTNDYNANVMDQNIFDLY